MDAVFVAHRWKHSFFLPPLTFLNSPIIPNIREQKKGGEFSRLISTKNSPEILENTFFFYSKFARLRIKNKERRSLMTKKNLTYPLLIIGSFLTAISVNTFAVPNHLGEGGVPGVTMILYYLFSLPTSVTSLLLNGALIILGLKLLPRPTIFKTILVVILNSIFLHLLAPYPFVFENPILAPLVAGFFMGAGIGLVYQGEGTTAGGTIVAAMIEAKTGLPKSSGVLLTDLMVIIPSGFVIGFEKMCLTIISVYLGAKVIAFISEGAKPKRTVVIISPKAPEISAALEKNIQRNGTFLTGTGSFSKAPQTLLYIVVESGEILPLKKTVHEIDDKAFMVVSEAQNVLGTRFSN